MPRPSLFVSALSVFLAWAVAQPPSLIGRGFPFLLPIPPPNSLNLESSTAFDVHPECATLSVRTLSGRCTSAVDPALGEARRAQMSYLDVDSRNFNDARLKSARVVSNAVADQREDIPSKSRINELFVFFGQFIDHDLVSTPVSDVELVPFLAARSPSALYETARAINIAQYQKIIYEEWLPLMLGRSMKKYQGYQATVNPTVSVEFSTAGFRVGHTMVGNGVSRMDAFGRRTNIAMQDMFFSGSNLKGGDIEQFVRGAMKTRAQQVDTKTVDALRNFLFSNVRGEEGIDLVALNLQRGRDHNIARYKQLRQFLTGVGPSSFSDISRDRSKQTLLETAYDKVEDVEAWVGLMAEDNSFSSPMGATNTELWRREFERLRDGDRWFYLDEERHGAIGEGVLSALPLIRAGIFSSAPLVGQILRRNTNLGVFDIRAAALFRA
ncbi:unnamed protein product [Agarophyton chilense]